MNPFSYGTVVRGDFFYDRKEECERIVTTLSGGNNMVLFAPRRYGKTSLVFRIIEQLEAQGFTCIYFDFLPVYSLETIVIFDEFQEIIKLNKFGFESLLRSKIQQQQQVNYLFLGSRTHLLSDMFNNKNRAFYNSASHMQIGTLPHDDTIAYLQSKFGLSGIRIELPEALYLIEQTGDIPYYIQLLAAEIWQYMITSQTEVTTEIIDTCAKQIVNLKQDYYYELFDRQSVMQKQLLIALLHSNENIFSAHYTKRFRLSAASTTQKSALVLMDSGIIDKTDRSYFISDPFFKRFLQNYAL